MRSRKIQYGLKKAKVQKEEWITLRDLYGIKDPTPYKAVKRIIRRQQMAQAL
ncbi:MAG: hypothetical protein IJH60_03030 [Eubacterium sp.]|nr:hypothetical protein [Eubacterium sp.]